MKRLLITMIVCLLCSVAGMNAQTYVSVSPSSPVSTQLTDVRYEFVQSTLNNSQAFLIDKYTGKVWRYRIMGKRFEEIEREEIDLVDTTKVNYQLYMSAENNSMCFLLNVHSGEMWRYGSKDGEKTFRKIDMPWNAK